MATAPAPSSAALAHIGAGFAEPVHAAQQVFRAVLQAMARPGLVQTLDDTAPGGLQPPGLPPAATALLLALLDGETRLHLGGRWAVEAAQRYLGFHTGVRAAAIADAAFVALPADDATPLLWQTLADGSDLVPQDGATLIVEVASLQQGHALTLRGPGVRGEQRLQVHGLPAAFWQARIAREADYPRGIDLVLTCGRSLAAIPRSTRIALVED
jgi:alpha-D-ribose 1-methylphosphonate 5-triphosphate synthase subunit PhnH